MRVRAMNKDQQIGFFEENYGKGTFGDDIGRAVGAFSNISC